MKPPLIDGFYYCASDITEPYEPNANGRLYVKTALALVKRGLLFASGSPALWPVIKERPRGSLPASLRMIPPREGKPTTWIWLNQGHQPLGLELDSFDSDIDDFNHSQFPHIHVAGDSEVIPWLEANASARTGSPTKEFHLFHWRDAPWQSPKAAKKYADLLQQILFHL